MSAKCFGILTPGCTQQRTSVPAITAFFFCQNNDPDETLEGKSDLAEKCDCACFKHHNDFLYCILTIQHLLCLQSMFEDAALSAQAKHWGSLLRMKFSLLIKLWSHCLPSRILCILSLKTQSISLCTSCVVENVEKNWKKEMESSPSSGSC